MDDLIRRLAPDERRDLVRLIGGVLLAAGFVAVALRKGSPGITGGDWSSFVLFLVLGAPAVTLYWLGMLGQQAGEHEVRPWQRVFLIGGIVLAPLALRELVEALGGRPGAALNTAWVFALTAGLALVALRRTGATYLTLLAAAAGAVAYLALCDAIVGLDADGSAYRWLLLLLAGVFAAGALALRERGSEREAAELVTASAVAAVAHGLVSVLSIFVGLAFLGGATGVPGALGAETSFHEMAPGSFWKLELLAVSLVMIAVGHQLGTRGASYAGAAGIVSLVVIAGLDLASEQPSASLALWPLALLLAGAMAIAWSLAAAGGGDGGGRPPRQRRAERVRSKPAAAAAGAVEPAPEPRPRSRSRRER